MQTGTLFDWVLVSQGRMYGSLMWNKSTSHITPDPKPPRLQNLFWSSEVHQEEQLFRVGDKVPAVFRLGA